MDGIIMLALVAAARGGERALIDHIESIDTKRLKLVAALSTLRVIASPNLLMPPHRPRGHLIRSIHDLSTRPPA
jgi:hypothetical protein